MLDELLDQMTSWQPYWLYESAPFIYVAAGLWLPVALGGATANIAGSLLVLGGLRILYMRWKYRGPALARGKGDATLNALLWNKSRECEHEIIDAEHRELLSDCHALVAAANGSRPEVVNPLIRELIRKLEAHFHREEKILHRSSPDVAAAQQREHHAISAKIHALYRGYIAGRIKRHELIDVIVHEAISEHMKKDKLAFEKAFWG
jgi:hemerythrin-like metal-binding protein